MSVSATNRRTARRRYPEFARSPRRVVRFNDQFGVLRVKVIGHGTRVIGFVVIRVAESDREGSDRPVRARLHQRDHEGRIDPAGEKRAEGNIGHHLPSGGIEQQGLEVVDKIVFGPTVKVALPRGGDRAKIPVAGEFGLAVRPTARICAGGSLNTFW